ncbi:GDSL-type esterase/lipase family protein [Coraliomargarita parva]|uniref:GDSL-type esterase/lipase family protein n=1 Tax=Coraliomargarita parva TaxID=3014050 RepID=UPI0022B49779|nr:GDSL-type esterase/lipase family protein [Coraliomargarita parva]
MKCLRYIALLMGLFITHSGMAEGNSTILPLGDSITEGGGHFVCYRQFLPSKLEAAGLHFSFVGPKQDAMSAHAGYSGKNTAYIASMIEEVYQQYPADVVLLHSGHNSFSKDKPVPGILKETDRIVRAILTRNPDAIILVAQVIVSGKLPKYAYIPELNEALAEYVRTSEYADNLVLVNQAEGFDWETDTVADKVHPNAQGAEKMADTWLRALKTLPRKEAGFFFAQ